MFNLPQKWLNKGCLLYVRRDTLIVSRCEPSLRAFANAVKSLNPLERTRSGFSESLLRDDLVTLAVMVLAAESIFDRVRLMPQRLTADILRLGKNLERCQEDLDKALKHAKEFFDLEFDKGELFAEAASQYSRIAGE